MTISPEDLVRREVHYCASQLVHTLASDGKEQAMELFASLPDYEEAATQAGWYRTSKAEPTYWRNDSEECDGYAYHTAEEVCDEFDLDPYECGREVFEHWIVSDWLADKLAERGEKVDKDFMGLTIWARTTTGQAIYLDTVIEDIAADLNKARGGVPFMEKDATAGFPGHKH